MVPVFVTAKVAPRRPVTVKFGTRVMFPPAVVSVQPEGLVPPQVNVTSPLNAALPTVQPLKVLTRLKLEQILKVPEAVQLVASAFGIRTFAIILSLTSPGA